MLVSLTIISKMFVFITEHILEKTFSYVYQLCVHVYQLCVQEAEESPLCLSVVCSRGGGESIMFISCVFKRRRRVHYVYQLCVQEAEESPLCLSVVCTRGGGESIMFISCVFKTESIMLVVCSRGGGESLCLSVVCSRGGGIMFKLCARSYQTSILSCVSHVCNDWR